MINEIDLAFYTLIIISVIYETSGHGVKSLLTSLAALILLLLSIYKSVKK